MGFGKGSSSTLPFTEADFGTVPIVGQSWYVHRISTPKLKASLLRGSLAAIEAEDIWQGSITGFRKGLTSPILHKRRLGDCSHCGTVSVHTPH